MIVETNGLSAMTDLHAPGPGAMTFGPVTFRIHGPVEILSL
jgi:hypothetical protein